MILALFALCAVQLLLAIVILIMVTSAGADAAEAREAALDAAAGATGIHALLMRSLPGPTKRKGGPGVKQTAAKEGGTYE